MKHTPSRFVVMGALALAAAGTSLGAASGKINYQARLLDACGRPLNTKVNLAFSLYTATTGGAALWNESHSGIQVTDGLYAVILGSKTAIPAERFATDTVYLQVAINGETLQPRQLITSAAQALVARTVMGPEIYVNQSNGRVGIGTQAPVEKLDVTGTIRATGFKMPTSAANNRVLTSDAGGMARWAVPQGITTETDPPAHSMGARHLHPRQCRALGGDQCQGRQGHLRGGHQFALGRRQRQAEPLRRRDVGACHQHLWLLWRWGAA